MLAKYGISCSLVFLRPSDKEIVVIDYKEDFFNVLSFS